MFVGAKTEPALRIEHGIGAEPNGDGGEIEAQGVRSAEGGEEGRMWAESGYGGDELRIGRDVGESRSVNEAEPTEEKKVSGGRDEGECGGGDDEWIEEDSATGDGTREEEAPVSDGNRVGTGTGGADAEAQAGDEAEDSTGVAGDDREAIEEEENVVGVGWAAAELVPEDGDVCGAFGAGVGEDDQDDEHRKEEYEDEAATYEGEEWAEEHVGFLRS